jgi:phage baseplate assembly protein W
MSARERFTSIRWPIAIDAGLGRLSEEEDYPAHVEQLMRQVLLTAPGERVNRPDFGSGLFGLLFSPASEVMAAVIQADVQASLQRWLADLVQVQVVEVEVQESTVQVTVQYVIHRTQQPQVASFQAPRALG